MTGPAGPHSTEQDAIAIELLYGDRLEVRGNFPVELVRKVQEDLPVK